MKNVKLTIDPKRLQRAYDILQRWLDERIVTAIASVLLHRGRLAGEFYGGSAAPAPNAPPINGNSLFHIASIGKPMTAFAVMLLVEAGRLTLDDPVADILTEFRGAGRDVITVRQLLTHTSGLPQDPDRSRLPPNATTSEELRTYLAAGPIVPPGSKVEYSNVGYGLLGLIIEEVGRQSFASFMHERVFAPAGLRDTWLAPPEDLFPRIVHVGGTLDPGSPTERFNSAHARRQTHPAGSVLATARDVARFFQVVLNGGAIDGRQVISPVAARLMITNQTPGLRGGIEGFMTWDDCAWGLGFDLRGNKHPHFSGEFTSPATFGHTGISGVFAWADPALDLVCVMLANRTLFDQWNTSRWSRFSTAVVASLTG
ncbi:serine hydrolase domain-containing protein [Roseiflexus castenholzii]|jgi:beta-lactamase class C|uniref:Beta-lactamase n=1 Tax=Roseiflexus castenholzii (strain DSM 13941 / HLO8) TaxID=383372 RepID=A7NH03_ROSCS|nr:serine hydrolase domain-containing protein [Roseiflexus castenholzii]ABU56750.1 beta-lactamase [Roseiflexus castenholzii DSM 13941]